jgi:HD superfamily phosphodiesterase
MPLDHILNEARLFLVETLKDQIHNFESPYPWRNHWKYLVLHSFRVEANVLKILERETHSLSDEKIQIIRLAAILHDVGKYVDRIGHATTGADIAREWLLAHIQSEETVERISKMIEVHGKKGKKELDYSTAVLKDADKLDEIGAMTILMTGNMIDRRDPFYLNNLCQRINEVEIPKCEAKLEKLRTNGAKEILQERRFFIEHFADQLISELRIEQSIEELLINL